MQTCPNCGIVYDESDYSRCPSCYGYDSEPTYHIVYDDIRGEALSLSDDEFEVFKETHPDYR